MDMLKALNDLATAEHQYDTHGSVESTLSQNGVDAGINESELVAIFDSLRKSHKGWVEDMIGKVEQQAGLFAASLKELKLPKYNTDESIDTSERDKQFLASDGLAPPSTQVNKLKSFLTAVKVCCVDIAGLKVDMERGYKALNDGRLFVYSFTVCRVGCGQV